MAGCSGDTDGIYWRMLKNRADSILAGYDGIYWRAILGYLAGSIAYGGLFWLDIWRDLLAMGYLTKFIGIYWRTVIMGYLVGSIDESL